MTGRIYLERGQLVTVTIAFSARRPPAITGDWLHFDWNGRHPTAGPRNVAIRRTDGSTVIRPFRGLRRALATAQLQTTSTHQPEQRTTGARLAPRRPGGPP